MGTIIWSEDSRSSLKEIWRFYAEKDIRAADRMLDEIISTVEKIKFGEQFQVEEVLGGKYRRAVVRHFKVIYRAEKDGIRVIEVFDSRQNPDKLNK